MGRQGVVGWCSGGYFGGVRSEEGVDLDVVVDRTSEQSSQADIGPPPAIK